ncbi:MAG: transposase [Oscillospiraceae bacterium]|nr:transposase [Oscillospiraceae bacterium]
MLPSFFWNRHFWCRGYYVDTVRKYEAAIRDYIRNQLDDITNDQISLKGFVDPFTGEPVK